MEPSLPASLARLVARRVLFVRDEDALYALAINTVRAWEDFRHIHRRYLEEVARG